MRIVPKTGFQPAIPGFSKRLLDLDMRANGAVCFERANVCSHLQVQSRTQIVESSSRPFSSYELTLTTGAPSSSDTCSTRKNHVCLEDDQALHTISRLGRHLVSSSSLAGNACWSWILAALGGTQPISCTMAVRNAWLIAGCNGSIAGPPWIFGTPTSLTTETFQRRHLATQRPVFAHSDSASMVDR
jgi:hypothetical protein